MASRCCLGIFGDAILEVLKDLIEKFGMPTPCQEVFVSMPKKPTSYSGRMCQRLISWNTKGILQKLLTCGFQNFLYEQRAVVAQKKFGIFTSPDFLIEICRKCEGCFTNFFPL